MLEGEEEVAAAAVVEEDQEEEEEEGERERREKGLEMSSLRIWRQDSERHSTPRVRGRR